MIKTTKMIFSINMDRDGVFKDVFKSHDDFIESTSDAIDFEAYTSFSMYATADTMLGVDLDVSDNDSSILVQLVLINLESTISEFRFAFETLFNCIVNYVDISGYEVLESSADCYMWESECSSINDISGLGERDLYISHKNCQREIEYVFLRDTLLTVDSELFDEEDDIDEEDNTFRPRSIDEILGDDDDDDED